jgi:hypothetical protein
MMTTQEIGIKFIPEWLAHAIGRTACRRFRWHGISCRGRVDHVRSDQYTWHPALKRWYL